MSDSRTPAAEALGTATETSERPPKRNHNRNASSGKPKEPLTIEQKQQAVTMSAAGHSCNKISRAIGKDRVAIKRHLDTPEAIAEVRDERQELVEIYREKARACVAAIDDDKIAKASALQLATSSGILLDKSLLLSGQPTQNVAVIVEVLDVLRVRRDEEDERQWRQSQAPGSQQGDEEIERQWQQAKALPSLPANQP